MIALHIFILFGIAQTGLGLQCYDCLYETAPAQNYTRGDPSCSDEFWGTTGSFPPLFDQCTSCTKEILALDDGVYAILRGCTGVTENIPGITAWDRQQRQGTCYTTELEGGTFARCACGDDFCNAKDECDVAYSCYEDQPCPTCKPEEECSAAATSLPVVAMVTALAATAAAMVY